MDSNLGRTRGSTRFRVISLEDSKDLFNCGRTRMIQSFIFGEVKSVGKANLSPLSLSFFPLIPSIKACLFALSATKNIIQRIVILYHTKFY